MKSCISQVTTLMNPFESDASAYRSGGWQAVELWLTKLEHFLESHPLPDVRRLFDDAGVTMAAAAGQGGLLLSRGPGREAHWSHFRRRLELLGELRVPILIVAADAATAGTIGPPDAGDFARAAASLGEASEIAASHGVRIALEFQRGSPICSCLETAVALVAQCGSDNAGICLDAFHFQAGPSKLEDLDGLPSELITWVQICDYSGVPRELAGDADRILPGDGDLPLYAIVERLAAMGYTGYVALELLNPQLWRIPADRVADVGHRAVRRILGRHLEELESRPAGIGGGPGGQHDGGP